MTVIELRDLLNKLISDNLGELQILRGDADYFGVPIKEVYIIEDNEINSWLHDVDYPLPFIKVK